MRMNSLPSKMISATQVKTCMKCEYFFFMWFQFSCDTLTKSVKLSQWIYLTRRHVSGVRTKDTKVKNTVSVWRKQRLAIGIDQSERASWPTRIESWILLYVLDVRLSARASL